MLFGVLFQLFVGFIKGCLAGFIKALGVLVLGFWKEGFGIQEVVYGLILDFLGFCIFLCGELCLLVQEFVLIPGSSRIIYLGLVKLVFRFIFLQKAFQSVQWEIG